MKGQWSGTTGGWKRMSKERKKEKSMSNKDAAYVVGADNVRRTFSTERGHGSGPMDAPRYYVGGLTQHTATGTLSTGAVRTGRLASGLVARTDVLGSGKRYIPLSALEALGEVFLEGIPKYGENNWKGGAGDKRYQLERWEHADTHLRKWLEGDRTENHLAKVMWFCATQIELERMEREKEEMARENQCAAPIDLDELFKGNLEEPPLPSPESTMLGEEGVEDVLKDLGIAVGKEALSAAIERFLKALKDNREREKGKTEPRPDTGKVGKTVKTARKRVISEEGKERIAAAQRKRWAKVRREKKAQERKG